MISELVRTYKVIEGAEVLMRPVQEVIGKCPCCGQAVNGFFKEIQKGHYSDSYCSTDFGGMFQPDNPDDEELGEIRPVK